MSIETTILSNFAFNEEYGRKIQPFLHDEYFTDKTEKILYNIINSFVTKYNAFPTKEALHLELENVSSLNEEQFTKAQLMIKLLKVEETKLQYLLDTTEKWCKDKALYNAALKAIQIMDGKDTKLHANAIPDLFTQALAVSFDNHVGHDYLENAEERWDFYQRIEERIPFSIEMLNKITKGGLPNKTLNVLLAGIGVGKTLIMCDWAANNLQMGEDVLYITMEMAEERISERIDANLLNVRLDELVSLSKEEFLKKITAIKQKTTGRLVIKEYPTAQASAAHFRHLIHELNIKKDFRPKVIYIDYINLCLSARYKYGQQVNLYTMVKSIAEELRGLAVETNVPIVTATQLNREGFSDSDPDMTSTAESFGLPATADLYLAIINSDELEELGQRIFKQLKNRYRDYIVDNKFVVGVDKDHMRLFNIEESAQNLSDQNTEKESGNKFTTSKFNEFK